MRKKTSIWASFLVAWLGLLPARAFAAVPTWTLTWSDEFSATNGTAPDPTRWGYDLGAGGWGNGELENYTNSTSNSYQDGSGHLVIQALNSGGYTSARLKSAGLFNQAYGRVEASIELPAGTALGSGLWPAFWMLGNDINSNAWPACGEIDIMENIGQYNAANVNLGHLHGPVLPGGADYYGGGGVGTAYTLPAGQATNTAYHLYAVEWNPTSVTFYVDGVAYQTLTAASLPTGGQWVFNHPFFIILNLAVGGGVGGPVTASFPQQLKVDYVRVYKLTSNGTSAYGGTTATVPGTVQAENFDTYNDTADPTEPAEGFAYNDLETANQGGQYRTGEGVDIEACSDTGGGDDVGWTGPGEWMQYTINCTQAGSYDLTARVAALGAGGTFHVDIDGVMVGFEMTVPNTGGWQTWADVTQHGIALTTGTHQMLVVEDSLGTVFGNINYFKWSLPAATASPTGTMTPTPLLTPTPSGPTPTPGTLVGLQSGMQMTCQFVNNTAGSYSNAQVYILAIARNAAGAFCHLDASGNMIPCVSGENASSYAIALSSIPDGLQFPTTMSSGRLYVSLGTPLSIAINTAGDGTVGVAFPDINNPGDANIDSNFDWMEFAVLTNNIWCNSTQVDMFGIPIKLQLYTGSSTTYSLFGSSGITECAANINAEYLASVPAAFSGLEQTHRIVAPIHGSFSATGANAGYFDSYINSVWTQYSTSNLLITVGSSVYTGRVGGDGRLAFTTPGDGNTYYVSKPSTNDVWGGSGNLATGNSVELALEAQICAAFHRHVIDNAANLYNPAAYYQSAPADFYSQFWHQHSLSSLAYGFCYDDVNNQSSTLASANPRGLIITIGGGACSTPSPTPVPPTPSKTPTRTPTVTRTATLTLTKMMTATATRSATLTQTQSATPSPSSSRTATPTTTRSISPSPSLTQSKTLTLSPTLSPTAQATASPSFTATLSLSPTPLASATPSLTASATRSVSPSLTATGSASPTRTMTATASHTASITPSATATLSRTPSLTSTATVTATLSPTLTPTPSLSRSPSASSTPAPTGTATGSATPTFTPTLSPANTPLPLSPTSTRTPYRRRGGLVSVSVGPNPGSGESETLSVKLDGAATQIQVKVYTRAYMLLREETLNGNYQEGWNQAQLPALNLSNGIYFLQVAAGGSTKLTKLMILK